MTQALRERIDAGEHFAADVTHELKNPIASLRSAIAGLERVQSEEQRAQRLRIPRKDVRRLPRPATHISDARASDAPISPPHCQPSHMGPMYKPFTHSPPP